MLCPAWVLPCLRSILCGYITGARWRHLPIFQNVPTRSALVLVTKDPFVSLVKNLNNKTNVGKQWCLLYRSRSVSQKDPSKKQYTIHPHPIPLDPTQGTKSPITKRKLYACKFIWVVDMKSIWSYHGARITSGPWRYYCLWHRCWQMNFIALILISPD